MLQWFHYGRCNATVGNLDTDIQEDSEMTIYRIFVADMGGFRESKNYEFVAEFADQKIAVQYYTYMRGKKRYRNKDIIIKEVADSVAVNASDGVVRGVISVLGEYLPVDEYEFS